MTTTTPVTSTFPTDIDAAYENKNLALFAVLDNLKLLGNTGAEFIYVSQARGELSIDAKSCELTRLSTETASLAAALSLSAQGLRTAQDHLVQVCLATGGTTQAHDEATTNVEFWDALLQHRKFAYVPTTVALELRDHRNTAELFRHSVTA